ncbi:MAG TPA: hypothetical protein VNQ72_12095 [Candidatus Dormibacteraeota bacterium]|nr:hypothetical protein [Candidatus Dormibacteraeota bacterium]
MAESSAAGGRGYHRRSCRRTREDTTTGQRQELSSQEINRLFERFPGRYRVVPSSDLK